jgi:hypothetical protein
MEATAADAASSGGGGRDGPGRAPSASASGRSGDDDRDDWRVLAEDWGFSDELARQFQACGAARRLIELAAGGLEVSEGDPLLVGVVDVADADSAAYASQGNYGLGAGRPGSLAWPGGAAPALGAPLPAGAAAAPPRALASFIRSMPGVVDKAGDGAAGGLVLHVESLSRLHEIHVRLQGTAQFCRLGPYVSGLVGAAAEHPELVLFYALDRMNGPPQPLPNFTKTA